MADTINDYFVPLYFEESTPFAHPEPVFRPMIRQFLDIALQTVFERQQSTVHSPSVIPWHGFQVLLGLRLQLDSISHFSLPRNGEGEQVLDRPRATRSQPLSSRLARSCIAMKTRDPVGFKQKITLLGIPASRLGASRDRCLRLAVNRAGGKQKKGSAKAGYPPVVQARGCW